MSVEIVIPGERLKAYLRSKYRTTNLGKAGEHIRLDDEGPKDRICRFCPIEAIVDPTATIKLVIRNCPVDQYVQELVERAGGQVETGPIGATIELTVKLSNVTLIRKLAKTIGQVVGKGRRYEVRNWKWIATRTARSLDDFAEKLMKFRRAKRARPTFEFILPERGVPQS